MPAGVRRIDRKEDNIADMRPERVCFLHVPKCAGRSIRTALADALSVSGVPEPQWVRLNAQASAIAADLLGEDLFQLRDSLLVYSLGHKTARFVSGHFRFVPGVFDVFARDWTFVTLLREPVARFVSEYYFNRFKASDHCRIHEGLGEFVQTKRARQMGEKYVRLFAGPAFAHAGGDDPGAIAQAAANLGRFQVVGLFEDLPGFVRRLESDLGVRLSLRHLNHSPRPAGILEEELTTELTEEIRVLCAPSQAVYAEACRLNCARGR